MKNLLIIIGLFVTSYCIGDNTEIIITNKPIYNNIVVTNNIEVFNINTNWSKPFMVINNKIKSPIDIIDWTPTNIIITFYNKPIIKQTTNGVWEITFDSND